MYRYLRRSVRLPAILVTLWLTLASACATVHPMPPLPDLGRLKLSPADSEQLALVVRGYGADSDAVLCFDPTQGDSAGVTPPAMISNPRDLYPSSARHQGLQGSVALEFIVGADGTAEPTNIFVLGFSDVAFVPPARSLIRKAVFTPARRNRKPMRSLVRQLAEFRLQGSRLRLW
jgi:hypothetical protein